MFSKNNSTEKPEHFLSSLSNRNNDSKSTSYFEVHDSTNIVRIKFVSALLFPTSRLGSHPQIQWEALVRKLNYTSIYTKVLGGDNKWLLKNKTNNVLTRNPGTIFRWLRKWITNLVIRNSERLDWFNRISLIFSVLVHKMSDPTSHKTMVK